MARSYSESIVEAVSGLTTGPRPVRHQFAKSA
jgi:hypothetical protein